MWKLLEWILIAVILPFAIIKEVFIYIDKVGDKFDRNQPTTLFEKVVGVAVYAFLMVGTFFLTFLFLVVF